MPWKFRLAPVRTVCAQQDLTQRVDQLTSRVDRMDSRVDRGASGAVLFLFGAFCALWAQNTKRSALVWFFLGVIFNVITVLVLLAKNADDRKQAGESAAGGSGMALVIVLGIVLIAFLLSLVWFFIR